ncbi:hypothetical protein [Azospirillum halopraeferens]|uniref:hypothetical protein n=1 Tax=Azospirillum halopraeferens TaxID=34010 RepID=UPI0003FA33D2|nr:hypothetical protein [Azospirillum halopraeferens]
MGEGRHLVIAIGGERFAVDALRVTAVADAEPPTPLPVGGASPAGVRVEGVGRFAGRPLLQVAPDGVGRPGGRLLVCAGPGGLAGIRVDRVEGLTDGDPSLPSLDPGQWLPGLGAGAAPGPAPPPAGDAADDGILFLFLSVGGTTVALPAGRIARLAEVERTFDRPGQGAPVVVVEGRLRAARFPGGAPGRQRWAVLPAGPPDEPVLLIDRPLGLYRVPPGALCRTAGPDGDRLWCRAPDGSLVEIPEADGMTTAAEPAAPDVAPGPSRRRDGPASRPMLCLDCGPHRILVPPDLVRAIADPDARASVLPRRRRGEAGIPLLDPGRLTGEGAGRGARVVVLGPAGGPGAGVIADAAALVTLPDEAFHPIPYAPVWPAALFDAVAALPGGPWAFRLRPHPVFAALPAGLRRRIAGALAGWLPGAPAPESDPAVAATPAREFA